MICCLTLFHKQKNDMTNPMSLSSNWMAADHKGMCIQSGLKMKDGQRRTTIQSL